MEKMQITHWGRSNNSDEFFARRLIRFRHGFFQPSYSATIS